MPRRGGPGSYDKFRERLNQTQAQQQRDEERRERERREQRDAQRLFEQEQAQRDEQMRQAQVGMSPWQREQMRMNDDRFLSRWGIRDHRQTSVPSADERLERVRQEREEHARKQDQERYEAGLRERAAAIERSAQIAAARDVQYRETMDRLAQVQARIAIERWTQHPGEYR